MGHDEGESRTFQKNVCSEGLHDLQLIGLSSASLREWPIHSPRLKEHGSNCREGPLIVFHHCPPHSGIHLDQCVLAAQGKC